MKKYTIEDIRELMGLPNGILQSKYGEIDNALAQNYLHKIIVLSKKKEFIEKKEYKITKELEFIQDNIDRMELVIQDLIKENLRLKIQINYDNRR